jgi:predicted nucleic acid-binding Zn finger protein
MHKNKCTWLRSYEALSSTKTEDLARDYNIAEIIASRRIARVISQRIEFYLVGVGSHVHIVIPRIYCSCTDFSINVASRCLKPYCVHMAAVELALRRRVHRDIHLSIERASEILSSALELEITSDSMV